MLPPQVECRKECVLFPLNSEYRAGAARCPEPDFWSPSSASCSWRLQFANAPDEYFGTGEPAFTIQTADRHTWNRILRNGSYGAAMAFVNGEIEITGDLIAAIRWWSSSGSSKLATWPVRLWSRLSLARLEHFFQSKPLAAKNIRFHYDQPDEFYRCFLDENLVYSCAYFENPQDSLDDAQIAKLDHICRKLELKAGDTFLDIGCGWGALPLRAAGEYGADATGCTLSLRQYEVGQRRATGLARILLSDYRDVRGSFKKIASVGMFEHVGRRRLPGYFAKAAALLEEDGVFLNHGIIRPQNVEEGPETLFLQRHVFPGGELAHLADVVLAAENAGFEILDIENLRPHYALTCRAWVSRLQSNECVALQIVSPGTFRTWLLYLAASSASFECGDTDIVQILMSKRGSRRLRHLTRSHIYNRAVSSD
jgi:cyclopropane-fatty-acyl-phospholipid synthase